MALLQTDTKANPRTDLSTFNNDWYDPGRGAVIRSLWYLANILFMQNPLVPVSGLKVWLLRLFGARIGKGVVIKPSVNIKYPWKLSVGDHVWIGENTWIDNLDQVALGNNTCLSQGAMLLCGSHNYKIPSFDLLTGPIVLEDGAWVGAKALVCPGVRMKSHSVLAAGSVATADLDAYGVFQGNPAQWKRNRSL